MRLMSTDKNFKKTSSESDIRKLGELIGNFQVVCIISKQARCKNSIFLFCRSAAKFSRNRYKRE